MSLDVTLTLVGYESSSDHSGIFIRENGEMKEISRNEWDKKFPDKEPVIFKPESINSEIVYDSNITHNLGIMADQAGLYYALWRPEERGWTKAKDLIVPISEGLERLKENPEIFKQYNPDNGWGDYDGLVKFTQDYLNACKSFPDADVSVDR